MIAFPLVLFPPSPLSLYLSFSLGRARFSARCVECVFAEANLYRSFISIYDYNSAFCKLLHSGYIIAAVVHDLLMTGTNDACKKTCTRGCSFY